MKASKSRISWFIKILKEVIPEEEQDVFGFPGISRNILVTSLEESYQLLTLLDSVPTCFETIFLEREIAELYDKASKLSKEDFSTNANVFNEFLKIIQELRSKIKETYILVSKEPIRSEVEMKKLRDELVILQDGIEKIKPVFSELTTIKESSESIIAELQTTQKDSNTKQTEIQNFVNTISSLKNKAQKVSNQIETWEEKIKNTNDELELKNTNYEELNKKVGLLKTDNEKQAEQIKTSAELLDEQIELNKKFQETIKRTIDDANRSGLASSFKARKDELKIPYWFWAGATIVTIISLIASSSFIIIKAISTNTLDLNFLLLRLPIFGSFVWLGWFCTKQFGLYQEFEKITHINVQFLWASRVTNVKQEKWMKVY